MTDYIIYKEISIKYLEGTIDTYDPVTPGSIILRDSCLRFYDDEMQVEIIIPLRGIKDIRIKDKEYGYHKNERREK